MMMATITACMPARGTMPETPATSTPKSGQSFPTKFPAPIKSYDVHIYFQHADPLQTSYARNLRDEILQKFPYLRTYRFHEKPIGPHATGMFETDLDTPAHFAEFVPWISLMRGDLPVLVHPNTGNPLADHTVNAAWFGEKLPLDEELLRRLTSGH